MSIKSLGRQSLIYGAGHVLSRIVTFLLLPLYTHLFTPDEYGVISLAYAFMGMALIFYRYGMDSALLKYAIAFKDESRIVYLSTIYTMQVITTIAFSAVIYSYSPILSIYILSIEEPKLIMLLSGILACDALWNLSILLLRAEEKPIQFVIFNLLNVLATMGLNIYFVVHLERGIEGVLLANLISSLLLLILSFPVILKRLNLKKSSLPVAKKILKFGLPFLPAGIFTMIMELANRYLLVIIDGSSSVGLFSAGHKIGMLGLIVVMGFNMGWTPYFLKRGQQKHARNDFSISATIFLGLLGFVMLTISLWVQELMQIKIGDATLIGEQFWAAGEVVYLILLAYFFFGMYVIQLPGVYMKNKTKFIPWFRFVGAASNILLNIFLIPKYGVIGSAWATCIAYFLMTLMIYIYSNKIYPTNYNLIACFYPIMFFGMAFFLGEGVLARTLLMFTYPLIWYVMIINENEKIILKSFIK